MRTRPYEMLPIFRSRLQAELLGMMILDPDAVFTESQLRDRTGAGETTIRRQLRDLEHGGLIGSDRVGRTKRYRAAVDSPIFGPLRELLQRTIGVESGLADMLERTPGVEGAAIFGSWASGGPVRPESDIDVLVIGDVDPGRLADVAAEVERVAGRDINIVSCSRAELQEKGSRPGFVAAILEGPSRAIVGTIDDLRTHR